MPENTQITLMKEDIKEDIRSLHVELRSLKGDVKALTKDVSALPAWRDIYRVEDELKRRISELEAWKKWALQTVCGVIFTAVLASTFLVKHF